MACLAMVVTKLVSESPDEFTWVGDHRLQAGYWRTAGVDPKFMACVPNMVRSFCKAVDPNFELVTTEENGTRLYSIQEKNNNQ